MWSNFSLSSFNGLLQSPAQLFERFQSLNPFHTSEVTKLKPSTPPVAEAIDRIASQSATGKAHSNINFVFSTPAVSELMGVTPAKQTGMRPKVDFVKTVQLQSGVQMHMPKNPVKPDGSVDFIIQFRGVVPNRFEEGGVNAVVITAETEGLSAAMMDKFGHRQFVPQMLEAALATLRKQYGSNVRQGRLALGSFSAGYAPLAVALSDPHIRAMTDAVMVVDGIHYGKAGKPTPSQHQPFVDFAREAAAGHKLMVITHSAIKPTYSSSTNAADYIMSQVGATRHSAKAYIDSYKTRHGNIISPETRADRNGFHVEGYAGNQARAHVEQIDNLGNTWNRYLAPRWERP